MTDDPTHASVEVQTPSNMSEVNATLKRLGEIDKTRKKAQEDYSAIVAVAASIRDGVVTPLDDEARAILAGITAYVVPRKRSIKRKYGLTVKMKNGTIKFFRRERSIDGPEDEASVIEFLQKEPGGEQYLDYTPTLDKRAIAASRNKTMLAKLRRRGLRVAKHEHITIQAEGMKPQTISRLPYPNTSIKPSPEMD